MEWIDIHNEKPDYGVKVLVYAPEISSYAVIAARVLTDARGEKWSFEGYSDTLERRDEVRFWTVRPEIPSEFKQ